MVLTILETFWVAARISPMASSIRFISSAPRTAAELVSSARALACCAPSAVWRVSSVTFPSELRISSTEAACSVALCARLCDAEAIWRDAPDVSALALCVERTTSSKG